MFTLWRAGLVTPRQVMFTLWRAVLATPRWRVKKLTDLQLVKKFSAFHGTRRFITALTSVCHLSLSWASPIQSIYPHPTSWRSIIILSTHLCLGLPSGLFPSGFPICWYTNKHYLIKMHGINIKIKYQYLKPNCNTQAIFSQQCHWAFMSSGIDSVSLGECFLMFQTHKYSKYWEPLTQQHSVISENTMTPLRQSMLVQFVQN